MAIVLRQFYGDADEAPETYWSLERCKRAYLDYIGDKRLEIAEQKESRCYRHGAQWTSSQVEIFNLRKQPVVTYNRIGRKIDSIVGLMEKLKQDPKAYPRNPRMTDEMGADLATSTVRYVTEAELRGKNFPFCMENAAVDGIAGVEMMLVKGDKGDTDIGFALVRSDSFFYDPRSFDHEFDDARYMGQGKWLDLEDAVDLGPTPAIKARIRATSSGTGSDLTSEPDRERKWFDTRAKLRQVRVVEIWYKKDGIWKWCLFTGSMKIQEGEGYFFDEKGQHICKFIMFSAFVDHDGDRYGFPRGLKSSQDEINQRRSKGLHELNSRRIKAEDGAFTNIEVARREAVRPDGVVIYNKGFEMEFDDQARIANVEGQLKFLEDAKNEIENFGPSPALIGQGLEYKSGRAINLLQQAGIAELGPFVINAKNWKLRLYRAIWCAVQRYWSAERWIRVTDNEGVPQMVQLNGLGVDPMTNLPRMINAVGQLDVNFVLDEGPDEINMMGDAYDTLVALTAQGANIPPAILLELAPLQGQLKRKLLGMLNKPDPIADQAKQIAIAGETAKVDKTKSETALNLAKAQTEAQGGARGQQEMILDASLKRDEHQMKMAEGMAKVQTARETSRAKVAGEFAKLQSTQIKSEQDLRMNELRGFQALRQGEEKHQQGLRQMAAKAKANGSTQPEARQYGGPVSPGGVYKVGEDGPETFVPAVPGYIVPNPKTGRVEPKELKARLEELIGATGLVGRPPPGGNSGSAAEWSEFLTRLARKESSYDPQTVGDVGKFGGHGSRGLFQLSPQDAITYGLQKTPFTYAQLADPEFNANMAVKIAAKLGPDRLGEYWGPVRRGFALGSEGTDPLSGGAAPTTEQALSSTPTARQTPQLFGGMTDFTQAAPVAPQVAVASLDQLQSTRPAGNWMDLLSRYGGRLQ